MFDIRETFRRPKRMFAMFTKTPDCFLKRFGLAMPPVVRWKQTIIELKVD